MKPKTKKQQQRRHDHLASRRSLPGKLTGLPEDQLAQIVAWLFEGKTYGQICAAVKSHFGVTCSLMAVKTVWDKFGAIEDQMRSERIVRQARLILQSSNQ